MSVAVIRRRGRSVRDGLYAALLTSNVNQADFDCDCDVRQRADIKPRIAEAL